MLNKRLLSLIAMLLCAGLTLAACGDDDPAGNNDNNSNNTNNEELDAGPDATEDADEGDDDAGEPDADPDTGPSGCESDDDCADGEMCDVDTGECVLAPSGCDLTGDDRPERCDQSFDEAEWGPVSLVNEFSVAGREVGGEFDPECCFDYTGDSEIDNALGEALDNFGVMADVNTSIEESIADGSLLLMFEHAGLTDLDAGETYELNFWLGEYNDADELLIDPASIDDGSYPQAVVENAVIQDGSLSAGPGSVALSIDLLDTPLSLLISQAQIEAEVDMDNSSIEDGVALTDGKLGGVIQVTDIYDGINSFAGSCDCLGIDEPLIDYSIDGEGNLSAECNENADADACAEAGEDSCETIGGQCTLLSSILPSFADVDLDDDGVEDSISIGAEFSTEAAAISGVADAE
ncbi:MAG: hypothetical protein ACLFVJ_06310 [Persicimonas sp.]